MISVIIPCYNEEKSIKDTLTGINTAFNNDFILGEQIEYLRNPQVIVVDDGSEDNTATEAHSKGAEVHSCLTNMGKGFAVRLGLKVARNPTILLLDADLSVRPKEAFKAVSMIEQHPNGVCIIGKRHQVIKQPLYRRIAGKTYKAIVYLKTGLWFDTQCPYKILHNIPKEVFDYKTDGFAFDVELLMRIKEKGIPIIEQDVDYINRTESKVTFFKATKMFFEIMKLDKR